MLGEIFYFFSIRKMIKFLSKIKSCWQFPEWSHDNLSPTIDPREFTLGSIVALEP